MKLKVRYSVTFECILETSGDITEEDLHDAIPDIDIPEGGMDRSVYVPDSFEVLSTEEV